MWSKFLFWLTLVCHLSSISSFCPSSCACDNIALSVTCHSRSHLRVVPIFLNPQIKYLSLAQNQIKDITLSLQFYLELTFLDISHNQIESLGSGNFVGLSSLSRLNISYNQIQKLDQSVFSGLNALTSLDLSGNQIGEIANTTFTSLPNLKEIFMDKNRLESISWDLFADLPSLIRLSLRYNFIQVLDSSKLQLPLSLRELDLSSNQMTRIWNSSFTHLDNLVELGICCNYIHTIETTGLAPLVSLKMLDLSSNRLSRVPTEAFRVLNSSTLVALDLSSNRLKEEFPPYALDGLTGLELLKLSDNSAITSFHHEAFAPNPSLIVIKADHLSNLSKIPAALLQDKSRLMLFSLKYAKITGLEDPEFFTKRETNEHHLVLPTGTLDLTGNPIDCNCSAYPLYNLVSRENLPVYDYDESPTAQAYYGHLVYANSFKDDVLSPHSPLVNSVQCFQPAHLNSVFLRDLTAADFAHCIQSTRVTFDSFQILVIAIAGSILAVIGIILALRLCCVCGCCEWLRARWQRAQKQGATDQSPGLNFRSPESAANSVTTTTTTSIGPLLDMCGKQYYVESNGPVLTLKNKRGETHYLPQVPPPIYVPGTNGTLSKNYFMGGSSCYEDDQIVYSEPIVNNSFNSRARDYYTNNGFSNENHPTLFHSPPPPGLYVGGSYKRNNNNTVSGTRRQSKNSNKVKKSNEEKDESTGSSDERPPVIVTYEYPDYPNSYRLKQVPSVLV